MWRCGNGRGIKSENTESQLSSGTREQFRAVLITLHGAGGGEGETREVNQLPATVRDQPKTAHIPDCMLTLESASRWLSQLLSGVTADNQVAPHPA